MCHSSAEGVTMPRILPFSLRRAERTPKHRQFTQLFSCLCNQRFVIQQNGTVGPRATDHDGAVWEKARRRKKTTFPRALRGRLPSLDLAAKVGGRWNSEMAQSLTTFGPSTGSNKCLWSCEVELRPHGCEGGAPSLRAPPRVLSVIILCWTVVQLKAPGMLSLPSTKS